MNLLPIDTAALATCAWLLIAALALASARNFTLISRLLYPAGAVTGLLLAGVALWSLGQGADTMVLPIGLPDLPIHLRLDALSAFFLFILGATTAGISTFAAGYLRRSEGAVPGMQCMHYHLFLAAMAFVLLADDGYAFMVAWESMALTSFLLVTSDHRLAEIRRAGYIYLLVAHIGAIAILLMFGVLQGDAGNYTFAAMRAANHAGPTATIAFLLALFGFGAKAGILPLHVWLPEAHPAAPSPVSAMMSGVMLKIAVYGMLRVSFDLLHTQLWWWGIVALAIGLATALFGVIFSAVQSDMKRLLAYSSIENIGLIFVGLGLAISYRAFGMALLAALALTATLYHCINHAFFKSLLFLCTGSVLHATKERNLGHLGGLIHRMPWVAWLALLGAIALAGLPPLNGFVSEWLLLQSLLFSPELPHAYINMLVPLAAGGVALTAALAGFVVVKFYGIVFLGQPREAGLAEARDCGRLERVGLMWLAALCVVMGLFPVQVIALIDPAGALLLGKGLGEGITTNSWMMLAPISSARSSYMPLVFLLVIVTVVALSYFAVRTLYHGRLRREAAWDCGFPQQTNRMQDTAEGFGQPLRVIFAPFYRVTRHFPSAFDEKPWYGVTVKDPFWHWLYLPIQRAAEFGSRTVGLLQRGRIAVYLMFSFFTLLALLFFVR